MKKLTVFLCLFFAVLMLHAKAIHEDYRKADEKAKVSYAFGMAIGSNFDLKSLGIDFDYAALAEGLKAMVEGSELQFSEMEAMEIIDAALQRVMEQTAGVNRAVEDEYLFANSQRPGVQMTPSGLQYEILEGTEGEKPTRQSVVRVNYTGTFIDGSLFDQSTEDNGSYIPLEHVIPGWTEGLMLMSVGSIYRFFIPSSLAYGKDGIQGIIPPYATLLFSVELLEIINDDQEEDES
ncbi:MAG: FKBP-type peptidyl-prolyl cis-trans isomerase [Treponema sp.]|nr:FKBP-type peptidyl-prolyl cis-trans isomerase [Treponema sp.]